MDRLTFRHAIASRIGQTLTPALCAAIEVEASQMPDRSIALDQFESLRVGDYIIHAERFADVLPELIPLHAEHWKETEAHRHGLELAPNYDAMATDDRAGRLIQFTVRHCGALIGGLRMYVYESRHTNTLTASEDALYVSPTHRNGVLGLRLLRYAENCLAQIGVRSIEANSKLVNHADVLMRRMKYTPIATQFHKIIGK
jgi:GNAT superfamily N-acetyltransferase